MGFLPFVNQNGRRVVRWHRLALLWVAIILASILGAAAASHALTGDWRYFVSFGIAWGVFNSALVTARGFRLPVEQLPPLQSRASAGGRN
jgi:hypothetical protein